jgi:two-component system cell cycle response regulator DivK
MKGTPKTVLVVDDYEPAAESTCRLLGILGYTTVACTDATKCVGVADQTHPDAVLLDITMPVISGLELVKPIREHVGPACKIVAVTGHADKEMQERCLSSGFDAFVVKPAIIGDLEAVLGMP